jgi:hypothetical protein
VTLLNELATEVIAVRVLEENGVPKPEHTYWKGFSDRTAQGLSLLRGAAAE